MGESSVISVPYKAQKTAGNLAGHSLFFKPIQPKLTINQPNDVYEQEADTIADKVMRMTDKDVVQTKFFKPGCVPVQRMCSHCEEEKKMQRKEMSGEKITSVDPGNTVIQRKLHLHSSKEATAFQYFLTANDAKNYQTKKAGSILDVSLKSATPGQVDDAFRVNILNTIINNPNETLLIRGYDLDATVEPHRLFKDGKEISAGMKITLRQMAGNILGAGGVTIASESLALASEPKYKGPVSPVPNESWIFYSTPSSLAHEFGHAFLLFSGTASGHGQKIPKTAGVKGPDGKVFEGDVNVFIKDIVAEKQTELFDDSAIHFSPTAVRDWPEPPDYKPTFKGTWLQFLDKYPGSTAKQEVKGKKKILKICVATPDTLCMP